MRKLRILICCLAGVLLAVVVGLTSIAQQVDMLAGDFEVSVYSYINFFQLISVAVIFFIGIIFVIYKKRD